MAELRPARHPVWQRQARPVPAPDTAGVAPGDLREMSERLCRVAAEERSQMAGIVPELRSRPRDVLGGTVDPERGSARLRLPDMDLVIASADLPELKTVVVAASRTAVGLSTAVASASGPAVLVFTVDDWTVTVAAYAIIRA